MAEVDVKPDGSPVAMAEPLPPAAPSSKPNLRTDLPALVPAKLPRPEPMKDDAGTAAPAPIQAFLGRPLIIAAASTAMGLAVLTLIVVTILVRRSAAESQSVTSATTAAGAEATAAAGGSAKPEGAAIDLDEPAPEPPMLEVEANAPIAWIQFGDRRLTGLPAGAKHKFEVTNAEAQKSVKVTVGCVGGKFGTVTTQPGERALSVKCDHAPAKPASTRPHRWNHTKK